MEFLRTVLPSRPGKTVAWWCASPAYAFFASAPRLGRLTTPPTSTRNGGGTGKPLNDCRTHRGGSYNRVAVELARRQSSRRLCQKRRSPKALIAARVLPRTNPPKEDTLRMLHRGA